MRKLDPAGAASDVLHNLHLLRVVAALGVVYFHLTSTAGLGLEWDVGSHGVDVFFVISGFIIAYIGTGRPQHFLRRRLIRIVPFYWAATLAVFGLAIVTPQVFRTTTPSPVHLIHSLAFIPRANPATGETMPTLVLGWSLNLEMFFYVLFAIGLWISPRRAPLICVGAILGVVVAIRATGVAEPALAFYGRPLVFEFCFGVAAYYVFQACRTQGRALGQIAALKWLLVAVLATSLVISIVLEHSFRDRMPRYLIGGVPAFFTVTSALLLEDIYRVAARNRLTHLLGEASYIIYLVHPYIVFGALRLVVRQATLPAPLLVGVIVLLLALASTIAVAVHVWFEKPVMALLRARLTRRRETTVVSIPVVVLPGPVIVDVSTMPSLRMNSALIPRKWMRDLVAQLDPRPRR